MEKTVSWEMLPGAAGKDHLSLEKLPDYTLRLVNALGWFIKFAEALELQGPNTAFNGAGYCMVGARCSYHMQAAGEELKQYVGTSLMLVPQAPYRLWRNLYENAPPTGAQFQEEFERQHTITEVFIADEPPRDSRAFLLFRLGQEQSATTKLVRNRSMLNVAKIIAEHLFRLDHKTHVELKNEVEDFTSELFNRLGRDNT